MAEFEENLDFLQKLIPREIYSKLAPFGVCIDKVLRISPDFAHGPLHVAEVRLIVREIGLGYNFSFARLEEVDQESLLHDEGYKFCKLKLLENDEHHFGSAFIASCLGCNNNQILNILRHSLDRDERAAFSPLILRVADRLAGLGWSGVLRELSYLSDPVGETIKKTKDLELITDLRGINTLNKVEFEVGIRGFVIHYPDYEVEIRDFCGVDLFPNLNDKQKSDLREKLYNRLDWLFGNVNNEIDDVLCRNKTIENYVIAKTRNTREAILMLK